MPTPSNRRRPEVRAALTAAIEALVDLGARLVPVTFPSITDASTAWGHLCMVEAAIAHEATYPSQADAYGPGLGGFIEAGRKVTTFDLGKAQITRGKFAGAGRRRVPGHRCAAGAGDDQPDAGTF